METIHRTSEKDQLLSETEAQRILPMSLAWYRRARLQRRGPRFLRVGRKVWYRVTDLLAYIESRPSGGEQPQAPGRAAPRG